MKPGERIRQLRKAQGLTLQELALRTESDVGNLSRLERGLQGYSEVMLDKIARALSVDMAEFFALSVGGKMLTNSHDSQSPDARQNRFVITPLDITALTDKTLASADRVDIIRSIELEPGQGKLIFGTLPPDAIRLMNIKGDSMAPTLQPTDLIFIDVQINHFVGDGIYVFEFNSHIFVKRLQQVKGVLYVLSDNPGYKEWTVGEHELAQLHIAGRVILSQSQQYRRHG